MSIEIRLRASEIASLANRHPYQDCKKSLYKFYSRDKDKTRRLKRVLINKAGGESNKDIENFIDTLLLGKAESVSEYKFVDVGTKHYKDNNEQEQKTGHEYVTEKESVDIIERSIKELKVIDKDITDDRLKRIEEKLKKEQNSQRINRVFHGTINENNTFDSMKRIYSEFSNAIHNNTVFKSNHSINIGIDEYGDIGIIEFTIVAKPDGIIKNSRKVIEIKNRKRFWDPSYDIDQLALYSKTLNSDGGYLVQHVKNNEGINTKENIIFKEYTKEFLHDRFEDIIEDLTDTLQRIYRIEQIINGTFDSDIPYTEIIELFNIEKLQN